MDSTSKRGIGHQVVLNTFFNYICLFSTILTSLFITRILYFNLGAVNYGFWQVLWMVFGYSLLLDFGFGLSIQKYAAEYTVTNDVHRFSELLSSVIVTYMIMSVIIILATLCAAPFIDSIFKFENSGNPSELRYFKIVFAVFGIGAALVFPIGVFSEILHGLGRIDLRCFVYLIQIVINFVGIYLIFELGFSLLALTLFSILLNLFISFCMAAVVYKKIPDLTISLKLFSFSKIKEIATFSLFAYLTMFSKMVVYKTDQIIVGVMLGMSSVAIYHIGSRLSMLMSKLSTKFQENLAPIAAALYKAGDFERLRWVMFKSNRLAAFIATGVFIIFFMLLKPILYFWLKITENDNGVYSIAMIMLVAIFIMTLFRHASDRFMLMANQHKYLAKIAVVEAVSNLVLSIVFIRIWGVVGVALGSLVPNVIVSLFVFFPFMCKFGRFSKRYFIIKVYFPVFLIAVPSCAAIGIMTHFVFPIDDLTQWAGITGFYKLAVCSIIGGGLYVASGYAFLMSNDEKLSIVNKVMTTLKLRRSAI